MVVASPVSSLACLASCLGVTDSFLRQIMAAAEQSYRRYKQKKRNGGHRLIEEPFPDLKLVQRRLLDSVLNHIPAHRILHGAPRTSTRTASLPHLGQPMVIKLDIQDFFPSVTANQVSHAFMGLGFPAEVSAVINRLVTSRNRLPQGALPSPAVPGFIL